MNETRRGEAGGSLRNNVVARRDLCFTMVTSTEPSGRKAKWSGSTYARDDARRKKITAVATSNGAPRAEGTRHAERVTAAATAAAGKGRRRGRVRGHASDSRRAPREACETMRERAGAGSPKSSCARLMHAR